MCLTPGESGAPPSRREIRDENLKCEIARVHAANYGIYDARKVWLALNREGVEEARCTVEQLMAELGLRGRCVEGSDAPRSLTPRPPARLPWSTDDSVLAHRIDCG